MEGQLVALQQQLERIQRQNDELNRQNEAREEAFQQQQQQINALQNAPVQQGVGQAPNNNLRDAKRALSYMPSYAGKTGWRTFEQEWKMWSHINSVDAAGLDFNKGALLCALKGSAADCAKPYGLGTTAWTNATSIDLYLTTLRGVFMPPEESELSRSEFQHRKQGKSEDISSYLSSKLALWQNAFTENERSFTTLYTAVIAGIYNPIVKRQLRRSSPADEDQLRQMAVRIVANERESYFGGYGESTSLDGLAAVSVAAIYTRSERTDEDMEIDRIEAMGGKFNGKCNKCKLPGHKAVDCKVKRDKKDIQCFFCKKKGHYARDCMSKKRQYSGTPKRDDHKPRIRTVENEESTLEGMSSDEKMDHILTFLGTTGIPN